MAPNVRLNFNVLIYQEDGWWIAHCLEMDLPAEGETPLDALKNLLDLVNVHVEAAMKDGDLGSIFSPAPSSLWGMYAVASDYKLPRNRKRPTTAVKRINVRELAHA